MGERGEGGEKTSLNTAQLCKQFQFLRSRSLPFIIFFSFTIDSTDPWDFQALEALQGFSGQDWIVQQYSYGTISWKMNISNKTQQKKKKEKKKEKKKSTQKQNLPK